MKKLVSYALLLVALFVAVAAIVLTSTGCVSTYVKVQTDSWTCYRVALGYDARFPKLSLDGNKVDVQGYGGEVDPELVKAVQLALETIIKAGVAVP